MAITSCNPNSPIINKPKKQLIQNELCLYSCPYKSQDQSQTEELANNILIDHDIFILSQNKNTKFADWLSYKVTPKNINADVKTNRYWKKDPKIPEEHVLIPTDYSGAYKKCNYDRGHQAPLASFKGTDWKKTNYVSNLTPQKASLNRGAWLKLENAIRKLVGAKDHEVYVITGTYYNNTEKLCQLETNRINYQIPNGYWKIIAFEENNQLKIASFLFPQNTDRKDSHCKYKSNLKKIEEITNLEFFLQDNVNDKNTADSEYLLQKIGC